MWARDEHGRRVHSGRVLMTDIAGRRKKRRTSKDQVKHACKRDLNTAGLGTVEEINRATWRKKSNSQNQRAHMKGKGQEEEEPLSLPNHTTFLKYSCGNITR